MVHADGSNRPLGTSSSWGEEQEKFEEIVIEEEASPAAGGLADSEEFAVDLGTGGELLVSSLSRRGLPTFDNSASSGAHFSVQSADTFPWRLPLPPPEDPPPSEPVGTPELWVSSESEGEAPAVAPPSRISRPSKSRKLLEREAAARGAEPSSSSFRTSQIWFQGSRSSPSTSEVGSRPKASQAISGLRPHTTAPTGNIGQTLAVARPPSISEAERERILSKALIHFCRGPGPLPPSRAATIAKDARAIVFVDYHQVSDCFRVSARERYYNRPDGSFCDQTLGALNTIAAGLPENCFLAQLSYIPKDRRSGTIQGNSNYGPARAAAEHLERRTPFNFLIYTPERSGSGGKLEVARAFAPRAELLILIDDGSDALQEFSEFERGAAIGIRLPRKPTAPSVRYVANLAEAAEHCLAYFQ